MNPTRRHFLVQTGLAGVAAGLRATASAAPASTTMPPTTTGNALPRWRGFNLQYLYRTGPSMRLPEEAHFQWIAEWGFDFVRIPLCYRNWLSRKSNFNERITPDDAFAVDESRLTYIDQIVAHGAKYGLHVCLCFHQAPGYRIGQGAKEPFDLWRDQAAVDAFTFHWNLFAERYRAVPPERLSFNLFNEAPWPNDNFNGAIYREAIAPAVAAIRRHRADRRIIADGAGAGNLSVPELIPLGIHQSVHCYLPGNLSHYRVDWMSDRTNWTEPQWPGIVDDHGYPWDRSKLALYTSPWRDLLAQGVGVHMGETGGSHRLPSPVYHAWLGDVLGVCRDLGIGWSLWDFLGESKFGILDTERADVTYEDWHGHRLDRQLLELLQRS